MDKVSEVLQLLVTDVYDGDNSDKQMIKEAKSSLLTLLIERLEKERDLSFNPWEATFVEHNRIIDDCISAVKEVFDGK